MGLIPDGVRSMFTIFKSFCFRMFILRGVGNPQLVKIFGNKGLHADNKFCYLVRRACIKVPGTGSARDFALRAGRQKKVGKVVFNI